MTELTLRQQEKRRVKQLAELAIEEYYNHPEKKGILLCEGTYDSIDFAVYSLVYPELVVVPCEGCTVVTKMVSKVLWRLKGKTEANVFAIIDRDDLTKKRIRALEKQGIFCTRLPFIENIICCPEVLKILCNVYGKNYIAVRNRISSGLLERLQHRIKQYLPINLDCSEWERSASVTIVYRDSNGNVKKEKTVTRDNVFYVFRSKETASQAACALGLTDRDKYYEAVKEQIKGAYGGALILAMKKYLPVLSLE
ncbi:MAG: DUF4435 domain-containing protein [Clostridia bacterium]|nr:DUF4435 domain-containing protein [Clostridia bacterium]